MYSALMAEGLTCEVQSAPERLTATEWQEFGEMLVASMTGEEFAALARNRETNCGGNSSVGVVRQALAPYYGDYNGELIEDNTIGGSSVQTTGWEYDAGFYNPNTGQTEYICGYDGYPFDAIWEVNNLPYSNYYREYLRFTGNDSFGNCIESLEDGMMARVYKDNSIRMCVSSARIAYCDLWYTPTTIRL